MKADRLLEPQKLQELAQRAEEPMDILSGWITEYTQAYGLTGVLQNMPGAMPSMQPVSTEQSNALQNIKAFHEVLKARHKAADTVTRGQLPRLNAAIKRAEELKGMIDEPRAQLRQGDELYGIRARQNLDYYYFDEVKGGLFAADGERKPVLDAPFDASSFPLVIRIGLDAWNKAHATQLAACQEAAERVETQRRWGKKRVIELTALMGVIVVGAGAVAGLLGLGIAIATSAGLWGMVKWDVLGIQRKNQAAKIKAALCFIDLMKGTKQNPGLLSYSNATLHEYFGKSNELGTNLAMATLLIHRLDRATYGANPAQQTPRLPDRQNEGR